MVERLSVPPPGMSWALWNANQELHRRRAGSSGLSVCVSLASPDDGRPEPAIAESAAASRDVVSTYAAAPDTPFPHSDSIIVYNEVLIAILKAKEVSTARVWLVARSIDPHGCGHVEVVDLYEALPKLSHRRVRQILNQGNGRYWVVTGSRVYLKSQEKVAARLGVFRARRQALAVPVARMAQSVKAAKAVCWNAVHCGRKPDHPISRKTLGSFGVRDPRTQRSLERIEGVTAQQQFAVIGPANEYERRQAEENGEPVFTLKDSKGHVGQRGRVYLARHLPNVYTGTLKAVAHGKKWFNRRLRMLHEKGPGATVRPAVERVFFADGKQAGRAWDKQPLVDTYWPARRRMQPRVWWTMRGVSSLQFRVLSLQKGEIICTA